MSGAVTRAQIVAAADRLFYRRGYAHTSFAVIARDVGISRGNFYYHFRSKDDILDAVIDARVADTRAMLRRWETEESDPVGRVRRFVHILLANHADIENYGCPVGTLTTELAKLDHTSFADASSLFTLFRTWLGEQFASLGHGEESDALAMHVLAFSQGVATLANALRDGDFVCREVARMCEWLDSHARRPAGG